MPQTLAPLDGEQLYTLKQLASDKRAVVRRGYDSLKKWREYGAENLSGDIVYLECVLVRGIAHTSLESLQRFIAAMNSQTLDCHCLGGCLDGRRARLSDHVSRVTSGELIRNEALTPAIKSGAPADHLYYKLKWVDRKGMLRPFLVWSQVEDADAKVQKIVEGK